MPILSLRKPKEKRGNGMRCVDVARELGFSADWLRRAERDGKIPPVQRDLNGHRRYSPEDVKRLRELLYRPARQGEGK